MRTTRLAVRPSLVVSLLLVLTAAGTGVRAQKLYDPNANAGAAIDSALTAARADGKLVLLDFGADWCLDCVVLSRLFEDSTIAPVLKADYHVVRIDIGKFDRNMDLSRRYGSPTDGGVPAAVVLSPQGKVLVATRDGALESARSMNAAEVRRLLVKWAALKRTPPPPPARA